MTREYYSLNFKNRGKKNTDIWQSVTKDIIKYSNQLRLNFNTNKNKLFILFYREEPILRKYNIIIITKRFDRYIRVY